MTLEIVAEIGASHGQDLERAKRLCRGAIKAGADWVKLQTFTPDTISFPGAGVCPSGPWKGRDLYDLYREAHMPRDMQDELIRWMKAEGIKWFSTPFSWEDVLWLEERGCPMYKISSFDAENDTLATAVMGTGKKIIASDGLGGGSARADIRLRCVSKYPASPFDYAMDECKGWSRWGRWGISDHSRGDTLGTIAVAMGATMIEKHIKEDGDQDTADSSFAAPLSRFLEEVALWRLAHAIATSNRRSAPDLADIRPREVEINGRKLWRRCSSSSTAVALPPSPPEAP